MILGNAARRNVVVLALCQALAMMGTNIQFLTASLVGDMLLASDKALATLPISLQMTGTMLATVPASLLMAWVGRRLGFTLGTAIGATGASLSTFAIFEGSFALFCLGTFLTGSYQGFALFYRFAAADTADAAFKPKAVSLVMAGGVLSAVFGPEMAKWSRGLFEPVLFAGCYVIIVGLCLTTALLLQLVRIPRPVVASLTGGQPMRRIAQRPAFIAAAACGMIAYAVMNFVMTATPLAVIGCGFPFEDAAFVIQWHVLGMYAPSFFTGHLVARLGHARVMLAGVGLLGAALATDLAGISLAHFWLGLLLLGVGWNFLFVGASALLTTTHSAEERAKVQAANDFLVFGMVSLASFTSGAVISHFGWTWVNLAPAPLLLVAALVILAWRRRAVPAPA
jgi:MFS family permease